MLTQALDEALEVLVLSNLAVQMCVLHQVYHEGRQLRL
jgi:hypothetical protein